MPFGWPSISPARDMSLLGLPGFYAPRPDVWNFPRWTSIYDTSALEGDAGASTSASSAIDDSKTGFVVTAVDVVERDAEALPQCGGSREAPAAAGRGRRGRAVHAEHIMASGSLAPQFPWTRIGTQLYWDGGIVDNTPLGDAMEAFSEDDEVYRLLVVMNLYPLTGREPKNLLGVADRVHELSYGNRVRQDRAAAQPYQQADAARRRPRKAPTRTWTRTALADVAARATRSQRPSRSTCRRRARGKPESTTSRACAISRRPRSTNVADAAATGDGRAREGAGRRRRLLRCSRTRCSGGALRYAANRLHDVGCPQKR